MSKSQISTQILSSIKALKVLMNNARITNILSSNCMCTRWLHKPWTTNNRTKTTLWPIWCIQLSSRPMTSIALARQIHVTTLIWVPSCEAKGSPTWWKLTKTWSLILTPCSLGRRSTTRQRVAPSRCWCVWNAVKLQERYRTCVITFVATSHLSLSNAINAGVGLLSRVTETVIWNAMHAMPAETERLWQEK